MINQIDNKEQQLTALPGSETMLLTGIIENQRTASANRLMRYPLLAYWVMACAFSWLISIPLALSAQGIISPPLPYGLHYLSA